MDKVYYFSRCQLKTANKQYSSLKNDYEMTFTNDTVVAECMEDAGSVPSVKFEFVPICDIAEKNTDALIGEWNTSPGSRSFSSSEIFGIQICQSRDFRD